MKPSITRRLTDALEAGHEIEFLIVDKTFEDFRSDRLLQLGVLKLLETVGEALNRARKNDHYLEAEIKHLRRFVNLRNQIIHEYDKVDVALVWQVVIEGLPELLDAIDHALVERPDRRGHYRWEDRPR